jgi:hypothetical protein
MGAFSEAEPDFLLTEFDHLVTRRRLGRLATAGKDGTHTSARSAGATTPSTTRSTSAVSTSSIRRSFATYQEFAAYWPETTALDDPFVTPKLVVSKTLETVERQNTTLSAGGVVDQPTTIKRCSRLPAHRLNEPRIGGPADGEQ